MTEHRQYNRSAISAWIFALILAFPARLIAANEQLDSIYHSPEEISADLANLVQSYPAFLHVDTIGYGSQFGEPILLVRISDHPGIIQAKPAVLFIGQVHAEELVGVELTIHLIHELVEHADLEANQRRLQGLELYFIPTLNPDGLHVVNSGMDTTYRKNCRDNVGDGRFRFQPGIANDSSGVDLNRNFGLHWDRGDTLFFNSAGNEDYNYYAGPGPFSEPETQALRDLMLSRRFLFAISYHSSRSGNNSELVISPWNWEGKHPPDDASIFALCTALAARHHREVVDGDYSAVRAGQRVGQEQDWAYQATGCYMYMIEIGQTIQPDSSLLEQLIGYTAPPAFYLMDLALGVESINGYGILTINVVNRVSGRPIPAEVTFGGGRPSVLQPRIADPTTGRYDQLLPRGYYTVTLSADGYNTERFDSVTVLDGARYTFAASLAPLPLYTCTIQLIESNTGNAISGRATLESNDDAPKTDLWVDQESSFQLFEGVHSLLVRAPDYVPSQTTFDIRSDTTLQIVLMSGRERYSEDFSSMQGWQHGGDGAQWGIISAEGRDCLTESVGGAYPANANLWLMLETGVHVDSNHTAAVELIHRPYFEPESDYGAIDFYIPSLLSWQTVAMFTGFRKDAWDTTYLSLPNVLAQNDEIRLRFRVSSDASLEEDGWQIDRIGVYYSDEASAVGHERFLPSLVSLSAFPNPANGSLSVFVTVPSAIQGRLDLSDILGRRVLNLAERPLTAGVNRFILDGSTLPSGAYYLSLSGLGGSVVINRTIPIIISK